ncbi:Nlrp9b [Phodopus roborovskii]|uniref:Nlrp9b protein n=1 Tax=Phodopus roborovskii TaxID=109678 RepID=A0AAV0ABM9_PHORO|nr:Nlrp9b [Phodopus roborovskii]
MEETTGYSLTLCLQKLRDAEFLTFKKLLRKVSEQFKLKPIPWTEIEMISRKDMEMLLNTHYPGRAWDIALKLFLQVKRNDLWIMTQELRRDKQSSYREIMKTIFKYIWTRENYVHMPDLDYKLTLERQYRELQEVFGPQLEPVTAVVLGNKGEGKSTFLRKAMMDWASGILWQNRFHKVTQEWSEFCSVFQKLQVLDMESCNFNETVIQDLCASMSPSTTMPLNAFKLQSLSKCSFMTNFGDGALFSTLLRLPHLKSLNLYGTNLSSDVVENICSVLKCPTCRVEELLLGKCDISSDACGAIATSLTKCKVKHLSLVENPLKNKGVMKLCKILKHPSCVLETLMLSYCCLTFIGCSHLYEALLCNKCLSLLDLGSNFLEDTGVNILCEALKAPACPVQELWLDMCEFTTGCCADLALALTKCRTLTSLNLDWMTFDPDGLELLCEALNHKACNLKELGKEFSSASSQLSPYP